MYVANFAQEYLTVLCTYTYGRKRLQKNAPRLNVLISSQQEAPVLPPVLPDERSIAYLRVLCMREYHLRDELN